MRYFCQFLLERFNMSTRVYAVGRDDLPPFEMPKRFRHEITYFMSVNPGESGLPEGEYRVSLEDARRWLDDQVFELISPLDSEHPTEIELSEEQEAWLEWMVANQVEHVRLET